eukprot:56777-Lingulodinium_polyedra.AAC.1
MCCHRPPVLPPRSFRAAPCSLPGSSHAVPNVPRARCPIDSAHLKTWSAISRRTAIVQPLCSHLSAIVQPQCSHRSAASQPASVQP